MQKITLASIIFIFTFLCVLGGCQASSTSSSGGAPEPIQKAASVAGDIAAKGSVEAPGFTLKSLSGEDVTLSSFRGKNIVLLDFWATWCPPCRKAMPHLQKLHEDYESKGLKVISIDLRESEGKVRQFIKKIGITYTILLDTDGAVGDSYQVRGIPTMVLVDKEGKIRFNKSGYSHGTEAELAGKIEELLKE